MYGVCIKLGAMVYSSGHNNYEYSVNVHIPYNQKKLPIIKFGNLAPNWAFKNIGGI